MPKDHLNVLLIEDNPGDIRLIEEELRDARNADIDLATAKRLDEGLATLEEGDFDVVLLDLGLPDSSGAGTVSAVTTRFPTLPIVVLTGLEDERTALVTLKEGAQDYVVKGDYQGDLLVRIMRYARERKVAGLELERLREQLAMSEKLSTMGALVAGVASEIKGFTNDITANLYTIRKRVNDAVGSHPDLEPTAEGVYDSTVAAMEAVDRINRHVQDLRRFYRTGPEARDTVSLHEVVGDAVELFRSAERAGTSLELDLQPTLAVPVNRPQVQQVVLNLLQNAVDAAGATGTVRVATRGDDGGAVLVVEDDGPGVVESARAHLFEPFFTTKENADGLGLSIARRIAEAHGGSIDYEDRDGGGARFVVRFPTASDA